MADEIITVEWIATAQQMLTTIQKIDAKIERQEKLMQKLTDTSKKGATEVAGSFNKLEQELKENEAALKKLVIGSKEFDEQRKKVDALRNSLSGARGQLTQLGASTNGVLTAGVAKVMQMAAGMIGLQQAVSAIVSELEKVKALNAAAALAQRTVESAVAEMAINIGAENVEPARKMIAENAPAMGVTQQGLAGLLAAGISGGAKDLNEALLLAGKTLKLTAGDAEKARPIMSGMLTLAATTGNREFESVLGQLSQFQQAGRGEDFAMSINNMSTAIAAANTKGERIDALGAERTLEVSAAISQLIQDPTMAVTGTTVRQLVSKLDAFVPEKRATLDDGTKSNLEQGAIDAFGTLGTFDQKLSALQQDPEMAKQFLSTIEQNQGKAAIRQLVTGSEAAKGFLATAEATITGPQEAKTEFIALVEAIHSQTLATRANNVAAANIQAAATDASTGRGVEGQVREIVDTTLASVNMSGIDMLRNMEAGVAMNAAQGSPAAVIDAGIGALEALQGQASLPGLGIPVGGQVSESDKKLMQDQIELLKQIRDELARRPAPAAQRAAAAPARAARPGEAALPGALVP